jgi:CxxC motif-containing protein (DUF1111 family)
MMRITAFALLLSTAIPALAGDMPAVEPSEAFPGGEGTVEPIYDIDVFALPAENLDLVQQLDFQLGSGLFRKRWMAKGEGSYRKDGLGPLFNTNSCLFCHIKDGRGYAPDGTSFDTASDFVSTVAKLGVLASDDMETTEIEDYLASINPDYIRMKPHPVYGEQLQDQATGIYTPEGNLTVTWSPEVVDFSDGSSITLRRPDYQIEDLKYGPIGDVAFSPRITPQLTGLGLLMAIPEADIKAAADPDDADEDGVSGRAQVTWSNLTEKPALGRFGWKGSTATVRDQISLAFRNDMGISSILNPDDAGDCTSHQPACLGADHGRGANEDYEAITASLFGLAVYAENIGVPARRDPFGEEVLQGRDLFSSAGCASCHTPKWETGEVPDQLQVSNQTIWPYTDLLLHDMGPDLADGLPELLANGQEWRTPPLWGIGLIELTNGREDYLHDGRARSLMEAILWHGGEAQSSRDAVRSMNKEDRDALILFLESL